MFVAIFKAVIMCFPAVSAQGYWCSSVERAVPFHKCMFLTSGISGFTAVHRCKYFCAKCEHWQFSTADAGFSYSGTCTRSVGSCECTSYILSSFFFFGNLVCNCTGFIHCLRLPKPPCCLLCQHPGGVDSTAEVRPVSWAIKESVSRKMEKPHWDWKHSLPVYLPYLPSWLILLVNIMGWVGSGNGPYFFTFRYKRIWCGPVMWGL